LKNFIFSIGIFRTPSGDTVGASIARPAVLWNKTASPQGDVFIIFLRKINKLPYNLLADGQWPPLQCSIQQNDKLKFEILSFSG
jgi:hypothetical protein